MGFTAATLLYHSSYGLAKTMDPRGGITYPTLAVRYSELSSAFGGSERYQDTSDLINQLHTHTSIEVQEYMDTGIRKFGEEGICVSPTLVVSHQRNNLRRS